MFKQRIEKAFKEKEFLKIIFQYPASSRAVVKRGIVTDVGDNGFDFEEIKDGLVVYSYSYIVEIKGNGEVDYDKYN